MKLIDLLVQELPKRGGWPEGIGKISMHANGTTYRDGSRWAGGHFGLTCSDGWHRQLPSTYTNAVSREQYEAALAASKQIEWDGEGLPPVGCECEAFISAHNRGAFYEWRKVKVIHSGSPGSSIECIVLDIESTMPTWADEFRPVRTEAERKREEFAKSLCDHLDDLTDWDSPVGKVHALAIYDAIAAGKIPGIKLAG